MSTDPRRGDAAGRGRHHIASVAHHFLGEPAADAGADPRAVVVASAESLPVSAFVAAGAARTGAIAAGDPWGMLEEEGIPWSAREHLGDDARVRLLGSAGFARHAPAFGGGFCWHLGPVGGDRLDAWAAASGLPGCGLPTDGWTPHLFWCVAAEAAAALSPLTALSRLAGLLEPARVDVIVAPRSWPRRSGGDAAADDRVLARLRRRATEVCGRPTRLGVVTPGMGTAAAAALVTEFLHTDPAGADA